MQKTETIENFYQRNFKSIPQDLKKELGHFNVFRIDDFLCGKTTPTTYSRKDFYKIKLAVGNFRCNYADKTIEINGSALLFANPLIPYQWENLSDGHAGYFCIFTEAFFNHFGNIKDYPVFSPNDTPIFLLNKKEVKEITDIYLRMEEEIKSDYTFKYDVLRTLVFELIHKAMKLKPATVQLFRGSNANTRIASLFAELLELQFPIESPQQYMKLRSPQEFAEHLSVHVNHLNRALKDATGKTTSQCIAERVMQEAKVLLKHTDWNVSEIANCLGFEEPSHFIGFFRKTIGQTPRTYRLEETVE
ncbi:transcriptional regulator [Arachidicoccus ginsenosidimutans]|uniref:helix-turn-helix domain-containing protein n=1 Tax=Arachidicoccus sp. BS20 TaxID=1850526 RepID=UPI0007F05416|nr:response regulator transcription factor [Arachidicoccus sp. BS20]ANI90545.1 transcriptional regulator [Arachidicoccus sp. BS20]